METNFSSSHKRIFNLLSQKMPNDVKKDVSLKFQKLLPMVYFKLQHLLKFRKFLLKNPCGNCGSFNPSTKEQKYFVVKTVTTYLFYI